MFASLPSMRLIYAKDVIADSGDTYPRAPHSKVASLSLISCQAEPEPLFGLLSTFDYLVTLEYTSAKTDRHFLYHKKSNNTFWKYNALLHQAKHSLKKLTLRGVNGANHRKTVGPLTSFTVLEELDFDSESLLGNISSRYANLTELLPRSIKSVTLRYSHNRNENDRSAIVPHVLAQERKCYRTWKHSISECQGLQTHQRSAFIGQLSARLPVLR